LHRQAAAAATPSVPEEPSPLKHDAPAIPEGANEDGEEDEEDLNYPGDDDEPKVFCSALWLQSVDCY
jgi:hypothetical protein